VDEFVDYGQLTPAERSREIEALTRELEEAEEEARHKRKALVRANECAQADSPKR
jgi:hypothetical protein